MPSAAAMTRGAAVASAILEQHLQVRGLIRLCVSRVSAAGACVYVPIHRRVLAAAVAGLSGFVQAGSCLARTHNCMLVSSEHTCVGHHTPLQANGGAYPETVAVNLWGLDAIKSKGESVGVVLALVGARPVREGTGRVAR